MKKPKTVTNEKLAQMVANGFSNMQKDFSELKESFTGLEGKFSELETNLNSKLDGTNRRIDELALNRAKYDDLVRLEKRVDRVEMKLNIRR